MTLYDLTNTYFEEEMAQNAKARKGHSKEKRADCPLVTLGLVLDGSGFVRSSRMFDGNISEAQTLESMLKELEAPGDAMVIMDRGIATQANIDWLVDHSYRYVVMSRERIRRFDDAQAVSISSASGQAIRIERVQDEEGAEVRLYCQSERRMEKEEAMTALLAKRFEDGLQKLADGLTKPRGTKDRDKILQRIGRLKERCQGIGRITLSSSPWMLRARRLLAFLGKRLQSVAAVSPILAFIVLEPTSWIGMKPDCGEPTSC